MKFTFPKNYNYNLKILGFISYSTAIIDVVIAIIFYIILNFLFSDISIKIYLFIALYFPIFLFSLFGINREEFISVLIYMFKYLKNRKVYLYQKNNEVLDKKNKH